MNRGFLTCAAILVSAACLDRPGRAGDGKTAGIPPNPSRPVNFTRDIRPILARHCYACHGPDENQRKAKLRLDLKEEAFAEREGGRPFVPGSVDESEAVAAGHVGRPDRADAPRREGETPPAGAGRGLEAWVEQGAKWESHWAFEKPVKRPLPAVADRAWPQEPDRPLRAGPARARGADALAGSRPGDPHPPRLPGPDRACRRPPRWSTEFLADRAPDAYERLVDRLLAIARLRRAVGPDVARPGPVRRHQGLREGPERGRSGGIATG